MRAVNAGWDTESRAARESFMEGAVNAMELIRSRMSEGETLEAAVCEDNDRGAWPELSDAAYDGQTQVFKALNGILEDGDV